MVQSSKTTMIKNFVVKIHNVKSYHVDLVELNLTSHYPVKVNSQLSTLNPEHQKEHKLSAKHIVEEAMTAALVQKCNKCTKPFVKLSGCNKMTCNCGNLQCYVCGQNIRDYRHFERGKCPLHEQNDKRLDTKIMDAQELAMKQVMEQEEGLKEEDLRVEVKKIETDVSHQANPIVAAFGLGGQGFFPHQGQHIQVPLIFYVNLNRIQLFMEFQGCFLRIFINHNNMFLSNLLLCINFRHRIHVLWFNIPFIKSLNILNLLPLFRLFRHLYPHNEQGDDNLGILSFFYIGWCDTFSCLAIPLHGKRVCIGLINCIIEFDFTGGELCG